MVKLRQPPDPFCLLHDAMFCGQIEFKAENAPDRVGAMLEFSASLARAPSERWQSERAHFAVAAIDDDQGKAGEAIAFNAGAHIAAAGNVRLDNRRELQIGLDLSDGASDIELVLELYRTSGRAALNRIYGDFAFVIWDGRSNQAVCMRDHVGIVPFYYVKDDERLIFASELEALVRGGGIQRTPDLEAIGLYLDSGSRLPADRTFLSSVKRLPSAHQLLANPDAQQIVRWWDPCKLPAIRKKSDEEYANGLRELIEQAVRARLPRTGIAGSHMTGGLDSSAIAAVSANELRRQNRPSPVCFAWQPAPCGGTESPDHEYRIINAMVEAEGFDMRFAVPEQMDVVECFTLEPFLRLMDVSLVQELPVMRAAEKLGIRVILSGWGGDDCVSFNGRGVLPNLLFTGQFERFARLSGTHGRRACRKAAGQIARIWLQIRACLTARLPGRPHNSFRHPKFRPWQARSRAAIVEREAFQVRVALLNRGHLQNRIDCWADSGARHGIVYRYPLLDRRLMEYALGLPVEQFRRGPINRFVMRQALEGLVPEVIAKNQNKSERIRVDATATAMHAARDTLLGLPGLVEPSAQARKWIAVRRVHDALKPDARKLAGTRPSPSFGASRATQFLGSSFL